MIKPVPAVRRPGYYLAWLISCLVVFIGGWIGINQGPAGSGLSYAIGRAGGCAWRARIPRPGTARSGAPGPSSAQRARARRASRGAAVLPSGSTPYMHGVRRVGHGHRGRRLMRGLDRDRQRAMGRADGSTARAWTWRWTSV